MLFRSTLLVKLAEQTAKVGVVRRLFKGQVAAVVHVFLHFFRIAQAKRLDGAADFAVFDLVVFVFFVASTQTLPRQLTLQQIKQHIACTLEVIPAALLKTQVSVGGCIPRCASKTFALAERNVLPVRLLPLFGKTVIDEVKCGSIFLQAHQDILRLQISVNNVIFM